MYIYCANTTIQRSAGPPFFGFTVALSLFPDNWLIFISDFKCANERQYHRWIVCTMLWVSMLSHCVQSVFGCLLPLSRSVSNKLALFCSHFFRFYSIRLCNRIRCISSEVCANLQSKFLHHRFVRLFCRFGHFIVNAAAADFVVVIAFFQFCIILYPHIVVIDVFLFHFFLVSFSLFPYFSIELS